jgi:hypothetical protein
MRQAGGGFAPPQLGQLLPGAIPFAQQSAQHGVDESGLRFESHAPGELDGFVDGGVIGDTVEPEKLVEAQAQQDLQRRFLGALLGFLVDEPFQGFFPTDNAISEFLRQTTIGGRDRAFGELAFEKVIEEMFAIAMLKQHPKGNFSWFLRVHPLIMLTARLEATNMKEEFEKLVAAGKIGRQHVDPLVQLTKTGYCVHRSWGFGKITTIDTVFARFIIDFQNKQGHTMDLGFAAESLKPISPTHILARKAADLEGLRQMAALHHLELIKLVLQSYNGRATIEQIQQVLVPDVIRDDWKKWWEVAKRELKKDGHFQVPVKKSDPVTYHEKVIALDDQLLSDFRIAKGLKAKVTAAQEIMKSLPDLADKKSVAREAVTALNADIASHHSTQPPVAL